MVGLLTSYAAAKGTCSLDELIFDLFQNQRIRNVEIESSESRRRASLAVRNSDDLRLQVQRLELICHALWELLSESTGATDQQLKSKVREIDLRDGRLDGRLEPKVISCSGCGRQFNHRHPVCIYCGESPRQGPLSR